MVVALVTELSFLAVLLVGLKKSSAAGDCDRRERERERESLSCWVSAMKLLESFFISLNSLSSPTERGVKVGQLARGCGCLRHSIAGYRGQSKIQATRFGKQKVTRYSNLQLQ